MSLYHTLLSTTSRISETRNVSFLQIQAILGLGLQAMANSEVANRGPVGSVSESVVFY